MSARGNPLAGVRVLVGRARHQASALSAKLEALGADVIEIPFIDIRPPRSYRPFDTALKQISTYNWIILTSVNGVEALSACMEKLQISRQKLAHLKIAAIGPATQQAIQKLGLEVSVVPSKYVAEAVVDALRGKVEGQRVLLARARIARDVIPRELRKIGAVVDVVEAYETVVPAKSKKLLESLIGNPQRRPHVVTFTSSSTVKNFVELLGGRGRPPHTKLDGIYFASIGPITSSTLRELELPVHIEAEEYTIDGLSRAVAALFAGWR
ncbi:MAG TPA: uroporphyrinogen-III synthase [Terriglobales bacterium]|nr:uroporphyrinogen-III synthase [Terriglobales bacterium]